MNNYSAKYTARTYSTWNAAMLLSVALHAAPGALNIEHAQHLKSSNGPAQAVMSGKTSDGLQIKPTGTSTCNADLVLAIASQKFTDDLANTQQSLGYEFSKIIDDNILDLLA